MGSCMTKACQCHLCRCCECGRGCRCCLCCRMLFGDWWMCSDCCEEDDDEEMIPQVKKTQKRPDDGEGMYQYDNGDFYVGEWRRGKRHGYGNLEKADGTRFVGFFYDDEFVGDKPDERLNNSPVTRRPFAKPQVSRDDDEGILRKTDEDAIAKAKEEEERDPHDRLLNGNNANSYDAVSKD
ncbi:uncharacterized protein LOC116614307 [Nematostella vectensis]|uniref:uncharacterized protein LOC116614307 n=1 Tax=Nematostella vectensis TaxID=45351 RepID=UPI0020771C41|nr:uncharacterized protein LOC116614307 [Nematostella vectensis]